MEEDQESNQKSIIELQHEISIYKNRELVYLVLYFLKSQQLKQLTLYKQNLVKENDPSFFFVSFYLFLKNFIPV